jgi:glyoxylase-like metal-dependent hydrolase (beta-lactamase superfamily II)
MLVRDCIARFALYTAALASTTATASALAGALAPDARAAGGPARTPTPLPPRPAPRTFVQVKDDVWRAGVGNWWSFIYVTPDGIVLVDPNNTAFATWVKSELARRFPGIPVRYIIYSHSHWDHVGGAGVFADSNPHIVAQERVLENMDGRFPHFPGNLTDRNNNGTIEPEEMDINTLSHPGICGFGRGTFDRLDSAHTGHIGFPEWWRLNDVLPPDMVYSQRMTLRLGNRTIELIFPGLNHADDGTVVFLPAERVAFSADFPADALVVTSMRSLPSACGVFDHHPLSEWLKSYRTIEALDFDILVQGHGLVTFTKADVAEGRQFFEDLRDAVSAGMARGQSLQELKKTVRLEKYRDWGFYDMLLPEDVESAYLNLKLYR